MLFPYSVWVYKDSALDRFYSDYDGSLSRGSPWVILSFSYLNLDTAAAKNPCSIQAISPSFRDCILLAQGESTQLCTSLWDPMDSP